MAHSEVARSPTMLYFSPMIEATDTIHTVYIVVFDQVQLLDFAGPLQTFVTAEERWDEHARTQPSQERPHRYRTCLVSSNGGAIKTSSGVTVLTENLPETVSHPATIIMAGGWGVERACQDGILITWLQNQYKAEHRICSVCTGAFILAKAGLLDGRKATTHWSECQNFALAYPNVHIDPKAIYTQDDTVWTSAGITSGIDLSLALIEHDRSAHLATSTAHWLVVYTKRVGSQSQFSDALELAGRDAEGQFTALHDWITENLQSEITLATMAAIAGMSQRSLSRKYKHITGLSPAKAVRLLRAEKAKTLLATTQATFKTVSRQCGFQSVDAMNTALEDAYGASARFLRETTQSLSRSYN